MWENSIVEDNERYDNVLPASTTIMLGLGQQWNAAGFLDLEASIPEVATALEVPAIVATWPIC